MSIFGLIVRAGDGAALGQAVSAAATESDERTVRMVVLDRTLLQPRARGWDAESVTISVVIPTLNEAANLPHVFARLPACVDEVILVDGHSTDDTVAVAVALLPSVRVVLQRGRGKGNALACGFEAARGDIIVMLDADGSTDPAEIPAYVAPLLTGADFAKGSRFAEGGGSVDITLIRRLGNSFLNGIVNVLYGTQYTDLCYGYNAFWKRVLPMIDVTCDGFEVETLINIRAARAGLVVKEVPSVEQERIHGVSKLHPVRDGLRVLRTIFAERLRRSPRAAESPVVVVPEPVLEEMFGCAEETVSVASAA